MFRIPVDADETTRIRQPSRLMVGKITTVPRSELGERIGRLPDDDMARLARSVVVFSASQHPDQRRASTLFGNICSVGPKCYGNDIAAS